MFTGRVNLLEAFMMPRLRALLPKDAYLSVDASEIFLPRVNPTADDKVRFRRFFSAAYPYIRQRPRIHIDNLPHSKRTR